MLLVSEKEHKPTSEAIEKEKNMSNDLEKETPKERACIICGNKLNSVYAKKYCSVTCEMKAEQIRRKKAIQTQDND